MRGGSAPGASLTTGAAGGGAGGSSSGAGAGTGASSVSKFRSG